MQEEDYEKIEEYVTSIPDFPEPGIIFRDITSVIGDPDGLKLAIDSLDGLLEGVDYDVVAGQSPEALSLEHHLHIRMEKDLHW